MIPPRVPIRALISMTAFTWLSLVCNPSATAQDATKKESNEWTLCLMERFGQSCSEGYQFIKPVDLFPCSPGDSAKE